MKDEWIEHSGGPCPVDDSEHLVEVRLRDGTIGRRLPAEHNWSHGRGPFAYEDYDDIIAYRVVQS
jgi:hypothetical protein